jgi:beta-amylase
VPTRRLTRTLQQFEPIPLYVMLELDTVDPVTCELKQPEKLYAELFELRRAGVKGVMVDVWWGIVERQGPRIYDWKAYIDLVEMVAKLDLTLQAVMSFHQCGGNIGDACTIPLPKWVLEIGNANPDIYYTDASMSRNNEYLSLGVDLEPLFPPFSAPNGTEDTTPQEQKDKKGRTAVDMYRDFMSDFAR